MHYTAAVLQTVKRRYETVIYTRVGLGQLVDKFDQLCKLG